MTIFQFLKKILKEQPLRYLSIVATVTISGFFEGIGIALFIPLFQMIESGQDVSSVGRVGRFVMNFLAFFGLQFSLATVLFLVFIIIFLGQIVFLLSQKLVFGSIFRFESLLRDKLYKAIFNSEWRFFLKEKTGDLTSALTVETIRASSAFNVLNKMTSALIITIIYLTLAFTLSWQMTVATIFLGSLIFFLLNKRVRKARSFGENISKANAELEQEAVEQISGAKIVKSSAAEEVTTNRFKVRFESLARFKYISRLNQALLKVIFEVLIIGVLCIGIYSAIIYLKMTMSRLVVFLFIFYRLSPRMSNLQQFRHQLLLNLPALESIEKFCEKAKKMEEKSGDILFKGISQSISLKNVYFYYNPEEYVIEDLNIEIPKKKTIAIVGGSGAGKSTVVDLIMGLLKPVKGEILVDGKHLSEYDLKSWRRKIGYLTQDTILFHDTVKANIAWFYPEATGEEIKEAAKIAFADEFIEQFNKDYDTIVGDRGVRLSGGQKQRIALARAIIRKPEILILDEATSALDAESEKKIQKAIQVLAESITVIIVTHRLATVKNADYIYVLENSKLIEEGSWNDLVSQKGRFFELKQLQELETVEKK